MLRRPGTADGSAVLPTEPGRMTTEVDRSAGASRPFDLSFGAAQSTGFEVG